MKVCNNKKYRTREGMAVVINRKRVKGSAFPVRGRVVSGLRGAFGLSWTEDGHYLYQDGSSRYDLVEVQDAPL